MAKKSDEAGNASLSDLFAALSLDEQKSALAELQAVYDGNVQSKREELMAQLEALGGLPKASPRNVKISWQGETPTRKRESPKPAYRTPDGSYEWSGRGAIPKPFKALGVLNKAGMEQYRI